ncbi:MAG TPA: hypothetical protein EYP14_08940 [Planctomycetaceae bacterium]|nr:hypothetical protein [Planctomycetaceae bacterium]
MDLRIQDRASKQIAECVERLVRSRTGGRIRNLKVEVTNREIILSGRTTTYYDKQLATHAALAALEDFSLTNEIEVC